MLNQNSKRNWSKENKINHVLDEIVCNLRSDLRLELYEYLFNLNNIKSIVDYNREIRLYRKFPAVGKNTKNYWITRGWTENEAKVKLKLFSSLKGRLSPFSIEFWIEKNNPKTGKNYTNEEAEFERNVRRPIKKEYWLNMGYTEQESIEKAKQFKDQNNSNGNLKSVSRPIELKRYENNRCVEYWISRGYTEENARSIISQSQKTFTLEKCKLKYGEELGFEIWKNRQDRWQNTLKSKTKEEIKAINIKKNSFDYHSLSKRMSNEEIKRQLIESRNINLSITHDEFHNQILNLLLERPDLYYTSKERFMDFFPKIQLELLGIDSSDYFSQYLINDPDIIYRFNSKGQYRKRVKEGLLRSAIEIICYNILKEHNIELTLDKCYPNTKMRYDFYIPHKNHYLEICPMYNGNDEYSRKMDLKEANFGSILIKTLKHFIEYLDRELNIQYDIRTIRKDRSKIYSDLGSGQI